MSVEEYAKFFIGLMFGWVLCAFFDYCIDVFFNKLKDFKAFKDKKENYKEFKAFKDKKENYKEFKAFKDKKE